MNVESCIIRVRTRKPFFLCLLALILCTLIIDIGERHYYELYGSQTTNEYFEHKEIRTILDTKKRLPSGSSSLKLRHGTSTKPSSEKSSAIQIYDQKEVNHNVMEQREIFSSSRPFLTSTKTALLTNETSIQTSSRKMSTSPFFTSTTTIPLTNGTSIQTSTRKTSTTPFLTSTKTTPFTSGTSTQTSTRKTSTTPFITSTKTSPFTNATRKQTTTAITTTMKTTKLTTTISRVRTTDYRMRCAEVRRRVSEGVVDFIRDYGDDELRSLIKPLFQKKKLVVWSLDHHIGPISDMRSLFEPLGVEFLEHTLYNLCDIMCTCEQRKSFQIFNDHNIIYVKDEDIKNFYEKFKNEYDIQRTDAFLVSYSMAILPLYALFNRSIIAISPVRYERTLFFDTLRWHSLNKLIRTLDSQKRHIIGANNLYDKEYLRYFTGIVPEYIPSFCAYTGVHYNPTRMSYLYARRPYIRLGNSWHQRLLDHFKKIRANFTIEDLSQIYKNHTFEDVASHLGVVYVPYQVSLMSFFEQYTMGVPLFTPTLDFLLHLHMVYFIVYDKTMIHWMRQKSSLISPHPSINDTYDPNNEADIDSVQYWLSLSDFYHFPHVTLFDSIEKLVEILNAMTMSKLKIISENMMRYNRERLKLILRYWRQRLVDIAAKSEHRSKLL